MLNDRETQLRTMEESRTELCMMTELVSATIEDDAVELLEPALQIMRDAFGNYMSALESALERYRNMAREQATETKMHA